MAVHAPVQPKTPVPTASQPSLETTIRVLGPGGDDCRQREFDQTVRSFTPMYCDRHRERAADQRSSNDS